jgi:hypothetical protein
LRWWSSTNAKPQPGPSWRSGWRSARICTRQPDLAALGVELHPFDFAGDGPAVAAITTRLRRRHATDSAYIRLAQQLDTHAWTLDGPLARNAADADLPVKLIT